MKRGPAPDDFREDAIHLVAWEVWMLKQTGTLLANNAPQLDDDVMHGAVAVAHATHVRNLIEFLFGKPNPREFRATDFASNWGEHRPTSMGRETGRISAEFSHIGKARLAAPSVVVHDPALVAELLTAIDRWLELVPPDIRATVRDYRT